MTRPAAPSPSLTRPATPLRVALTVDFEPDCPPYLSSTFRGIEQGAPRLLELFAATGVRATYFTTSEVAERYPASRTPLWGLVQPVAFGADRMTFGLATQNGKNALLAVVDFADGSLGTGYLSLNARQPCNERFITGPDGAMRLVDDRTLYLNGEQLVHEPVTPYIDGDPSFEAQMREFAAAVAAHREPQASAREVRPVTVVLQAALESQRTGLPVELAPEG